MASVLKTIYKCALHKHPSGIYQLPVTVLLKNNNHSFFYYMDGFCMKTFAEKQAYMLMLVIETSIVLDNKSHNPKFPTA